MTETHPIELTSLIQRSTPRPHPVDQWIDELPSPLDLSAIPWQMMRNRALTPREKRIVREFYSGDYPEKSDYTCTHPWHLEIAKWRLRLAQAVLGDLGRTLDAGCAAGEVVRVARAQGLDCFGFDLCPDLFDVCYEAVTPHVRMGSLAHIPFSRSDGFKTVISYDVIEHSPINELELFPQELQRLGVSQVACVISTDTLSEGHITIQDTDYYRSLLASCGYRLLDEFNEALQTVPGPVAWNQQAQAPIWAQYSLSGKPQNGWNTAPGYLFFRRDA